MEHLRWIILGVGILVVLVIYLLGRRKNRNQQRTELPFQDEDELPYISTESDNDELDGLSLTTRDEVVLNQELIEEIASGVDDGLHDAIVNAHAEKKNRSETNKSKTPGSDTEESLEDSADFQVQSESDLDDINGADTDDVFSESTDQNDKEDDLLIIYLRATSAFISGEKLGQFINKFQLKFGDMNIYHARDDNGNIIFSVSNMLEPGYFQPETLNELQTPGVILFMQLSLVDEPVSGFRQMLYTAQSMEKEFGAQLCDANKRELDRNDFELMQEKAERFEKIH